MRKKKKQSELHARDLAPVIKEVIRRLPNGETRFTISDVPMDYACQGEFFGPDLSELLASDYGLSTANKELEKQYIEEITLIEKIMVEMNIPINIADWQSLSNNKSDVERWKSMNRRSYAMQLWNWYAIPWRFRQSYVHIIFSPQDIMGHL